MRVLIFGGTSEGRKLAELLVGAGADVTLSVATRYGESVAENSGVKLLAKRMDENEIRAFLKDNLFDYVIDATHPYAEIATKNIKPACDAESVRYIRLLREKSVVNTSVTYASTPQMAADMLENTIGNIFITVGSKELEAFVKYRDRSFVRILPMKESLEKAVSLGFQSSNIICMQGPFNVGINTAMLKAADAKYLVTKDSGAAGGFSEKLEAAALAGCKVIVISRPEEESGYTYGELLEMFKLDERNISPRKTKFFPLFVDLCRRKVTVIGGGKIAERRVKTLCEFGAEVTVISPEVTEPLSIMTERGQITHIGRSYQENDISDSFFVIAATNDRDVNRKIAEDAKINGIPVSVADSRKECDCFFPAIAQNERYTAGIVSNDGNHKAVKEMAVKMRELIYNGQKN